MSGGSTASPSGPATSPVGAAWRSACITPRESAVVIEFPPTAQPRFGAPQLQPSQIAPALVAKAIASAIAAGWEPLSRGKTVAIVVDADGG